MDRITLGGVSTSGGADLFFNASTEDPFQSNSTEAMFQSNSTAPPNNFRFEYPRIPYWISLTYFCMLCLSVGLGIPGNVITAAAYLSIKNKSNCDWYIFFMALFDLLACVFRNTAFILEYLEVWLDLSTSGYCRFIVWVSQSTVGSCIFLFALIAIDRYFKLCNISQETITPQKSRNITLVLTLVNVLTAAPCLYLFDNLDRGVCQVKTEMVNNPFVKAYYSIIFILFLLMMLIVVYCYISIAVKVRRSRRVGLVEREFVYKSEIADELSSHSISFKRQLTTTTSDESILTHLTSDAPCVPQGSSTVQGQERPGQPQHFDRHVINLELPSANRTDVRLVRGQSLAARGGGGESGSRTAFPSSARSSRTADPTTLGPTGIAESMNTGSIGIAGAITNGHIGTTGVITNGNSGTAGQLTSGATGVASPLTILHAQREFVRQQRNIRVTGLLFVVTSVFILSWIPPYAAMIKGFFVGYTWPLSTGELVLSSYGANVYVINTFSNPVIYAAMSVTYRKHVKTLFTKIKISVHNFFYR
ncbi:uncharacterized protein LOC131932015 [Physella acuta]|uniref:uncharacterized protein LOC131932015 n=1 Tax=Physella acuta TaxID=109671 RepID=UPI0027DC57E9|nr:uncharacterized protein LOC131932015 [Physella acuta]